MKTKHLTIVLCKNCGFPYFFQDKTVIYFVILIPSKILPQEGSQT